MTPYNGHTVKSMLDEEDLQAIAEVMDQKISASEARMTDCIDRQKLEFRLDVLEAVTRRNIPEIEKLKKAR